MATLNRPAVVIAGIAGLCVSAAAGVGLGSYTVTGMSPFYTQPSPAPVYADAASALDGSVGDSASVDAFSEAAARRLTRQDLADRADDES